jgi:uncharacterized protein YbjT (DUF2867 family)
MIVVTTPTGFIGSKLLQLLLAAGEDVRAVARDPAKIPAGVRERIQVVRGSSDDEDVLTRALDGAESLFLVVPPWFAAPDVDAHYLAFTRAAIAAMKRRGVGRVVTVSGIGRRVDAKAGVVSSSLVKDVELERAGLHVRALWCPGFMENRLRDLPTLRAQGIFAAPSRPDLKAPQVATRDIAEAAARLLRDRSWTGAGGAAVLGPEDLSLDEMAAIMTDVLGRPIRYQQVPEDAYEAQLLRFGASEDFARGLLEMHRAKDRGLDLSEPRTAENTTPTTFQRWCAEELAPAFAAGSPALGG